LTVLSEQRVFEIFRLRGKMLGQMIHFGLPPGRPRIERKLQVMLGEKRKIRILVSSRNFLSLVNAKLILNAEHSYSNVSRGTPAPSCHRRCNERRFAEENANEYGSLQSLAQQWSNACRNKRSNWNNQHRSSPAFRENHGGQESERRHFARELHDEVGQQITVPPIFRQKKFPRHCASRNANRSMIERGIGGLFGGGAPPLLGF